MKIEDLAIKKSCPDGNWVAADGGTAKVFHVYSTRRKLLYCWQPLTGKHAYLDCESNEILSDNEASKALGLTMIEGNSQ